MCSQVFKDQNKKPYVTVPLVARLWLSPDSKTSSETLQEMEFFIQNFNMGNPGILRLQLNINISPGRLIGSDLDCLTRLILSIQNAGIAIEYAQPKISIYIPYNIVSETLLKRVCQLDAYYPKIELYILLSSSNESSLPNSKEAHNLARLLNAHYTSFRFLLLLDSSTNSLESLQDGKTEFLINWIEDSFVAPEPPMLEVKHVEPKKELSAFVEPLLALVQKYPYILANSTSGYCGLVALLSRMAELYCEKNKGVPSTVLPLLCCGAGIPFFFTGSSHLSCLRGCPYRISNPISCLDMIRDYCHSCPYSKYCTGCLIAIAPAEICHLHSYYGELLSSFNKSPRLVNDLVVYKPEKPILYHDWDYIYDPFRET